MQKSGAQLGWGHALRKGRAYRLGRGEEWLWTAALTWGEVLMAAGVVEQLFLKARPSPPLLGVWGVVFLALTPRVVRQWLRMWRAAAIVADEGLWWREGPGRISFVPWNAIRAMVWRAGGLRQRGDLFAPNSVTLELVFSGTPEIRAAESYSLPTMRALRDEIAARAHLQKVSESPPPTARRRIFFGNREESRWEVGPAEAGRTLPSASEPL